MALDQRTVNESKMAEAYILNSEELDDDYKNTLLTLISTSMIATNGITQEQKIQKMTECIQKLAVSQVGLLKNIKQIIIDAINEANKGIDQRIATAINNANQAQCTQCAALKHAKQVSQDEHDKKLLDEYKKKMGIRDGQLKNRTWNDVFMDVFSKPWIYVIVGLAMVSPYGVEIMKLIMEFAKR